VVILIINQNGIAIFKRKRQTPVAINADRAVTTQTAFERVSVPTGTVHVFGPRGGIQRRQLPSQAWCVCGLYPRARAGSEEALNAFVSETADH